MQNYFHLYQHNAYIEIGNHSYSHANNHYKTFYDKPDSVVADFLRCQRLLNIPHKFARLPGRNQWRLNGVYKNDVSSGSASADKLYRWATRFLDGILNGGMTAKAASLYKP